jgi:hypothetical protein
MTTNPSHPPSARQWHSQQWVLATLACLVSFALGYWIADRRQAGLVDEATRRQVKEFIQFADRLGVLDRVRLEEALIIAKESEWEDKDAEQWQEGASPQQGERER